MRLTLEGLPILALAMKEPLQTGATGSGGWEKRLHAASPSLQVSPSPESDATAWLDCRSEQTHASFARSRMPLCILHTLRKLYSSFLWFCSPEPALTLCRIWLWEKNRTLMDYHPQEVNRPQERRGVRGWFPPARIQTRTETHTRLSTNHTRVNLKLEKSLPEGKTGLRVRVGTGAGGLTGSVFHPAFGCLPVPYLVKLQ